MSKKLLSSEELSGYVDDAMDVAAAISPVGAVLGALSPSPDAVEDKDDDYYKRAAYMTKYAEDIQQADKMQKDYEQRNAKAVEDMSTPKFMKKFM